MSEESKPFPYQYDEKSKQWVVSMAGIELQCHTESEARAIASIPESDARAIASIPELDKESLNYDSFKHDKKVRHNFIRRLDKAIKAIDSFSLLMNVQPCRTLKEFAKKIPQSDREC